MCGSGGLSASVWAMIAANAIGQAAIANSAIVMSVAVWLFTLAATPSTASVEPDALVLTLDGISHSGLVTKISDGTVYQQSGQQTALADVLRIETGQPSTNRRIKSLVVMTNGDRMAVDIIRLRDDSVVCRTFDDHDLEIPIEFVRALVLKFPGSTKQRVELLGLIDVHDVSTIVSDHNGYIRVQDNKPTGSIFIIELPLLNKQ